MNKLFKYGTLLSTTALVLGLGSPLAVSAENEQDFTASVGLLEEETNKPLQVIDAFNYNVELINEKITALKGKLTGPESEPGSESYYQSLTSKIEKSIVKNSILFTFLKDANLEQPNFDSFKESTEHFNLAGNAAYAPTYTLLSPTPENPLSGTPTQELIDADGALDAITALDESTAQLESSKATSQLAESHLADLLLEKTAAGEEKSRADSRKTAAEEEKRLADLELIESKAVEAIITDLSVNVFDKVPTLRGLEHTLAALNLNDIVTNLDNAVTNLEAAAADSRFAGTYTTFKTDVWQPYTDAKTAYDDALESFKDEFDSIDVNSKRTILSILGYPLGSDDVTNALATAFLATPDAAQRIATFVAEKADFETNKPNAITAVTNFARSKEDIYTTLEDSQKARRFGNDAVVTAVPPFASLDAARNAIALPSARLVSNFHNDYFTATDVGGYGGKLSLRYPDSVSHNLGAVYGTQTEDVIFAIRSDVRGITGTNVDYNTISKFLKASNDINGTPFVNPHYIVALHDLYLNDPGSFDQSSVMYKIAIQDRQYTSFKNFVGAYKQYKAAADKINTIQADDLAALENHRAFFEKHKLLSSSGLDDSTADVALIKRELTHLENVYNTLDALEAVKFDFTGIDVSHKRTILIILNVSPGTSNDETNRLATEFLKRSDAKKLILDEIAYFTPQKETFDTSVAKYERTDDAIYSSLNDGQKIHTYADGDQQTSFHQTLDAARNSMAESGAQLVTAFAPHFTYSADVVSVVGALDPAINLEDVDVEFNLTRYGHGDEVSIKTIFEIKPEVLKLVTSEAYLSNVEIRKRLIAWGGENRSPFVNPHYISAIYKLNLAGDSSFEVGDAMSQITGNTRLSEALRNFVGTYDEYVTALTTIKDVRAVDRTKLIESLPFLQRYYGMGTSGTNLFDNLSLIKAKLDGIETAYNSLTGLVGLTSAFSKKRAAAFTALAALEVPDGDNLAVSAANDKVSAAKDLVEKVDEALGDVKTTKDAMASHLDNLNSEQRAKLGLPAAVTIDADNLHQYLDDLMETQHTNDPAAVQAKINKLDDEIEALGTEIDNLNTKLNGADAENPGLISKHADKSTEVANLQDEYLEKRKAYLAALVRAVGQLKYLLYTKDERNGFKSNPNLIEADGDDLATKISKNEAMYAILIDREDRLNKVVEEAETYLKASEKLSEDRYAENNRLLAIILDTKNVQEKVNSLAGVLDTLDDATKRNLGITNEQLITEIENKREEVFYRLGYQVPEIPEGPESEALKKAAEALKTDHDNKRNQLKVVLALKTLYEDSDSSITQGLLAAIAQEKSNLEKASSAYKLYREGIQATTDLINDSYNIEFALISNIWDSIPNGSTAEDYAISGGFKYQHFMEGLNGTLMSFNLNGMYRYSKFSLGASLNYASAEASRTVGTGDTAQTLAVAGDLLTGIISLSYYEEDGFRAGVYGAVGGSIRKQTGQRQAYVGGANFAYSLKFNDLQGVAGFYSEFQPVLRADLGVVTQDKASDAPVVASDKILKTANVQGGFKLTVGVKDVGHGLGFKITVPIEVGAAWFYKSSEAASKKAIRRFLTGFELQVHYTDLFSFDVGYGAEFNSKYIANSVKASVKFSF